jgi:hypothetical protein
MDCFGLGGILVAEEDIEAVIAAHVAFCAEWSVRLPAALLVNPGRAWEVRLVEEAGERGSVPVCLAGISAWPPRHWDRQRHQPAKLRGALQRPLSGQAVVHVQDGVLLMPVVLRKFFSKNPSD